MKRSWLVQRLVPRHGDRRDDIGNVFAFGGGLRNGGLTSEAMAMLPFRFDYMGAAEFEFGAVPKALDAMTRHDLVGGVTDTEHGTVLYLCDRSHESEVIDRIAGWASKPYGNDTKEMVMLHQSLAGDNYRDVIGWLELDNGFAFFTDWAMWREMCHLFGVELIGVKS